MLGVLTALIGALAVPLATTTVQAADLSPSGLKTGFQIDGNKDGGTGSTSFDWESFLPNGPGGTIPADGKIAFTPTGSYTTAQGYFSTGILDASFSWDNGVSTDACSSTAADKSGSPGSQTPNTLPWAPGSANVNDKGNLCSTGAAWEVVFDDNGVRHAVFYSYWTRLVGNGSVSIAQNLQGPLPGRCDDVLVVFDYDSSNETATPHLRRWQPNSGNCANPNGAGQWVTTGVGPVNFDWAVGVRRTQELGPVPGNPNNQQATFGEFAVDLTAAGLFSPDECTTFTASTMFTRTGFDFGAQIQDYLDPVDPLVLSNCGTLTVTKQVVPTGAVTNDRFDYEVTRAGGGIVLPDTDATKISDDLGVGQTDVFQHVLATDDYQLTELLGAGAWANQSIICTTTQPGTGNTLTYVLAGPGAASPPRFTVYPDTTTNCVITNATSTVTVVKQTLPDGSRQPFNFTIGGNSATLTDGGSATFAFAPGSNVDISEAIPAGWMLNAQISCSNGVTGPGSSITVRTEAAQNITCTFTNTQLSTIRISKEAFGTPNDTPFDFTGTWTTGQLKAGPINAGEIEAATGTVTGTGADFEINTELGDGTNYYATFTGVTPGTYSITELADQADTLLANLICTVGGVNYDWTSQALAAAAGGGDYTTPAFDLAPGDTVTCFYVNAMPGQIVVIKQSDPRDYDQPFGFEFGAVDSNSPTSFTLTPIPGSATQAFEDLPAGQYLIEETSTLPNWTLTDITCQPVLATNPSTSAISLAAQTATVDLTDGDIVTCTFTNTADPASLTLTKTVEGVASGYAWSFDFELIDNDANVVVDTLTVTSATPTVTLNDLVPGMDYSLREVAKDGWTGGAIVCTVSADNADADSFTLTPGGSIQCTVNNTAAPASVSVTKTVQGLVGNVPWAFDFELTPSTGVTPTGTQTIASTDPAPRTKTWGNLVVGETYTLTEHAAPGWTQGVLSCTGVTDTNPSPVAVTFAAQPAAVISCAITNSPEPGDITITKTTVGGDDTFAFVLTPVNPVGEAIAISVTTAGGSGSQTMTGLAPGGQYSLSETDHPGWMQVGAITCTVTHEGSVDSVALNVGGFTVAPGDAISCAVTNQGTGTIVVVKNVEGGNGTFDFLGTWQEPQGFSITTTTDGEGANTGSVTFTDIPSGTTYEVRETTPVGYDNTALTCVDGLGAGGEDLDTPSSVNGLVGTIGLDAGETVVCTFTNVQLASIVIDKQGLPANDATTEFDFQITGAGLSGPIAVNDLTIANGPTNRGGFSAPQSVRAGTYTISEVNLPAGWETESITCTAPGAQPVTGTSSVTATVGAGQQLRCIATNLKHGEVGITKTASTAEQTGTAGEYEVTYTVTATSASNLPESIVVDDEFLFPTELTRGATTVDGPSFPRAGSSAFPEDGVLYDGVIQAGASLVWTITTLVTVAPASSAATRACGGSEEPTGALNTVVLYLNEAYADDDAACAPLPDPAVSVVKEAPTVSEPDAEGVMTAAYSITVTNSGRGPGAYTLTDVPAFPTWVTILWIQVDGQAPATSPTFPYTLAAGRAIDAATVSGPTVHVYLVTIAFTVDPVTDGQGATCVPNTARNGLFNTAEVVWNGGTASSSSCGDIPRATVLTIDKTASGTSFQGGDSFTYTIVVVNTSVLSAASPVTVSDPIPANLRVTSVTTSTTASPRWTPCAVNGADANGFGGTLTCDLVGPLAPGASAPTVTLAVTVRADDAGGTVRNTATVRWTLLGDPDTTGEASDSVDVQIAAPVVKLAVTGASGVREVVFVGAGLLVLGVLLILVRRRRNEG